MSRASLKAVQDKLVHKLHSENKHRSASTTSTNTMNTTSSQDIASAKQGSAMTLLPRSDEVSIEKHRAPAHVNADVKAQQTRSNMPAPSSTYQGLELSTSSIVETSARSTTVQSRDGMMTRQLDNLNVQEGSANAEYIAATLPTPESQQDSHQIFTTYELVENLVYFMTTYDLTVATRVCVAWRDIIERSKDLRGHIAKLQPPGRKALRPDENRRGQPKDQRTWHLAAKIPKGKLLLTRVHDREMALFIPAKAKQPVICLDGRYNKEVVTVRSGEKRLVWSDKDGNEVCSTVGQDEAHCPEEGRGYFADYMVRYYGRDEPRPILSPPPRVVGAWYPSRFTQGTPSYNERTLSINHVRPRDFFWDRLHGSYGARR